MLNKEHLYAIQVRIPATRGTKPVYASMTCYLYDTKECPMLRVCCSETQTQEDLLTDVLLDDEWHIVLFNDNHNTFDHVIECLISSCGHDALQAEQCAMIVHFKGKCNVKSGSYDELAPIYQSLAEKDLTVELKP